MACRPKNRPHTLKREKMRARFTAQKICFIIAYLKHQEDIPSSYGQLSLSQSISVSYGRQLYKINAVFPVLLVVAVLFVKPKHSGCHYTVVSTIIPP